MQSLFTIFSHKLTEAQKEDAFQKLDCDEIVTLPQQLQQLWSQIPPEGSIDTFIDKFKKYLSENSQKGDYILIQGEFGATFTLVNWCLDNDRIPIYATTKRVAKEIESKNGEVKKLNVFKHVQFRRYKR